MSLKARFEVTNVGHMCNKNITRKQLAMAIYGRNHTASALYASVCDLQTQGLAVIHQQDAPNSSIKSCQKQCKRIILKKHSRPSERVKRKLDNFKAFRSLELTQGT